MRRAILTTGVWIAAVVAVAADSTIDPVHPYAYGANLGWMNARADPTHGAVIGQFTCAGWIYGANVGWINLGDAPTNGYAYGNAAANDCGVNHDGAGRLSGNAYGANIGWITFEQTYGQPKIDLLTGNLSGYAWGANVGWISLSNAQAYVRTTRFDAGPDSDGDSLPDPWERAHTNTLTALWGGTHDADSDGATDTEEYGTDTDPLNGADSLRIVSIGVSSSTNSIAWTSRPTRLYRLEATNTLVGAGAWTDAGPGLLGPPVVSPMTQTVSGVTGTARFYRVRAVMPLSE